MCGCVVCGNNDYKIYDLFLLVVSMWVFVFSNIGMLLCSGKVRLFSL